jgi:hypothetical protein
LQHRPTCMQEKGLLSYTGRKRYRTNTWNQDHLERYHAQVLSMRMTGDEVAEVRWAFSGLLDNVPVAAAVTSILRIQPLTGRIEAHTDVYDLRGGFAGNLMYSFRKQCWAQQQRIKQFRAKVCLCFCRFLSLLPAQTCAIGADSCMLVSNHH